MLTSPIYSRWIPTADIALLYLSLCLWWGLQNRLSAMRWSLHRTLIIPLTCHAYDIADSIVNIVVTARFITTMWLILVRQTIVVVISPPQIGNFATA